MDFEELTWILIFCSDERQHRVQDGMMRRIRGSASLFENPRLNSQLFELIKLLREDFQDDKSSASIWLPEPFFYRQTRKHLCEGLNTELGQWLEVPSESVIWKTNKWMKFKTRDDWQSRPEFGG